MLAKSDLPPNYRPGRFHFLEMGVYIVNEDYTCANFYGLRYHGGTPPICPKGAKMVEYGIRGTVVLYPNSKMLDGASLHAHAALPHDHLLSISPEMIYPLYVNTATSIRHTDLYLHSNL